MNGAQTAVARHAEVVRADAAGGRLAGPREVEQWMSIAALIALIMLVLCAGGSELCRGNALLGAQSGLVSPVHTLGGWWAIVRLNSLVLGLHFCVCIVGAIVGRRPRPRPGRWARWSALDRRVPPAIARAALWYGIAATGLSLGLQTFRLSHEVANLTAYSGLAAPELLGIVCLHAIPELIALFLPLGLLLWASQRRELDRLEVLVWQSLAVAVPLMCAAAAIETWVTPRLLLTIIR